MILCGFSSLTFLQHIAVTMATAVLKVATRVCERGMWRGGERMRDQERAKAERMLVRK